VARTYKVVAGDTLAKLAERFYGDSALYPLIAAANGIANPALVAVGQLLVIPEAPGHWEVYRSGGEMINESIGRCILPQPVPPGRRLVIETVTGYYYLDGGVIGAAFLSLGGLRYAFPWVQCGSLGLGPTDRRFFGFNHAVRLYVDGPATLQFDADGGSFTGGGDNHPSGGYTVTGYLEAPPTS
jgi:LysM repeat protein